MARKQRPPGWCYPWIFVGGMAVVIAVNGVMAYAAVTTFSGVHTRDHYRKGLAYNEALVATAAQEARGWRVAVTFTPGDGDNGGLGTLQAAFTDADGHPLPDLAVTAELIRPTHAGHDRALALVHQGQGRYASRTELPLPGQWDVRIHASQGQDHHQEMTRFHIR
ncbi:MAG: hypothetical protein EA406_06090 [Rhodospirillales bacterium]|nr:MAG: hypothetical protein EA406_06090 [Rhodospirillales bacterium]